MRESGVLHAGERFVVEIPREAGIRIEPWLLRYPPEEMVYGERFHLIDADSEHPKRGISRCERNSTCYDSKLARSMMATARLRSPR